MSDRTGMTDEELNAAIRAGVADAHAASMGRGGA